MAESLPWRPEYRCCWCSELFITREYGDVLAWVCPTEACVARQLAWRMVDHKGRLFYLPTPRQVEVEEAIASQQFGAICQGGSRGGGKSIGLRRIAQRYCQQLENFSVLFLRRTFPELVRNHAKFCPGEAKRLAGAHYGSYKMTFAETGSEIEFGHCNDPDDFKKYIGSEVDLLIFDQIEMFTEQQVSEIAASVGRIRRPTWRGLMLAGENPAGPLSAFVDELFISKSRNRSGKYPNYDPTLHHFIPSTLADNPYVATTYVDFLAGLAPEKREMYRWGRRDVFPRQMFRQWRQETHVLARDLPYGLKTLRALRWGYGTPGIVLWLAVLPTQQVHVLAELVLDRLDESEIALELKRRDRALSARPAYTVADPLVFNVRPVTDATLKKQFIGPSIAEVLGTYQIGVVRADDDTLNGWKRLHSFLRPSPDGTPWLTVDPACETLITSLRTAMSDETHPEELDPAIPAPGLHALRYALMSRPSPLADPAAAAPPVGSIGWYRRQATRPSAGALASRTGYAAG